MRCSHLVAVWWRPLFLQSAPSDAEANDEFNDFDTTDMSMMMEYKHHVMPDIAHILLHPSGGWANGWLRGSQPSLRRGGVGLMARRSSHLIQVSYAFTVCHH